MFSCGAEAITAAVGERASEEEEKIQRAGGHFRHNLGTAARGDDTAEKNRDDGKEEEGEELK